MIGVVAILAMVFAPAYGARQHAHVHGAGRVNIVVEGQTATVEFMAPAESIYGFEHAPQTAAERQQRDAALARLEAQIGSMIVFAPALDCQFTTQNLTVTTEEAAGEARLASKKSGEHREVMAEFTVVCQKPLAGSQVQFGITKVFPRLTSVKVQVLSGSKQLGVEITHDRGRVTL
jgi:hypothetical protein